MKSGASGVSGVISYKPYTRGKLLRGVTEIHATCATCAAPDPNQYLETLMPDLGETSAEMHSAG